jgi:hypothetical protein
MDAHKPAAPILQTKQQKQVRVYRPGPIIVPGPHHAIFDVELVIRAVRYMTPGLQKRCLFSGQLSYPLYMTHYAVLWMFGNYYASHKPVLRHHEDAVGNGGDGILCAWIRKRHQADEWRS